MLVLFDIDGTLLIRASSEHASAVVAAIEEVWGVALDGLPPLKAAGRTDIEIARQILLHAGVEGEAFDERRAMFQEASARHYATLVPADLSERHAPGAMTTLDLLAGDPAIRLSLVTGNLEEVAHLKLASARLGTYFERGQGGFGSDAEDRLELPRIARQRAATWNAGEPWPRETTVVVGDTPRDIACARADGVHVIAIPTGPYPADELRDADIVITNLDEVPAALTRLR
jgi:phosphoglycolate phosphatase